MMLLEYQAKEIFDELGINVKKSVVIDNVRDTAISIEKANLKYPVALKVQIPIGGRGKAGGIRFANNPNEADAIANHLMFSTICGFEVRQLLVEEMEQITRECYISIVLDRDSKMPMLIFSAVGGIDIEETAKNNPEKIIKYIINPSIGIHEYIARYVLNKAGLESDILPQFFDIVLRLYDVFINYNCLLAEINPLIIRPDGYFTALDGKMDIDDSAVFLHTKLMKYKRMMDRTKFPAIALAENFGFKYIPVAENGGTMVMSNGSGMLMNCVDILIDAGINVGAAMDLGGGASAVRIQEAVKILLNTPKVDSLFISIFGGITRCDEVAKGIKDGYSDSENGIDIIIRMEGTNRQAGIEILETMNANIFIVDWPDEGVEKLAERRNLHEYTD